MFHIDRARHCLDTFTDYSINILLLENDLLLNKCHCYTLYAYTNVFSLMPIYTDFPHVVMPLAIATGNLFHNFYRLDPYFLKINNF